VAALRSLRGGGHGDLYSQLVDLFHDASIDAVAEIKSALATGDLAAARAVSHKLASSAANVGALVFSRHVRQLEMLCESDELAAAQRLCERLASAHPALMAELAYFKQRASA
jgi:HPt (histidine-containing phosphotransfer) domain-containing protein